MTNKGTSSNSIKDLNPPEGTIQRAETIENTPSKKIDTVEGTSDNKYYYSKSIKVQKIIIK